MRSGRSGRTGGVSFEDFGEDYGFYCELNRKLMGSWEQRSDLTSFIQTVVCIDALLLFIAE
jgi:hypothetical protein